MVGMIDVEIRGAVRIPTGVSFASQMLHCVQHDKGSEVGVALFARGCHPEAKPKDLGIDKDVRFASRETSRSRPR